MSSKGINALPRNSQAHSNIESYLSPSELGNLGSTSTQKKLTIRRGGIGECKPRYHEYHTHLCDEIQTRVPNQSNVRYICCKDAPKSAEFYADRMIRLFPSVPHRPNTYKIFFLHLMPHIINSPEDFKQYIHFDQSMGNNRSISNLILKFLRNVVGKQYISNKIELKQLVYYLHTRGESYNPEASTLDSHQGGGVDIFNLYKSSKNRYLTNPSAENYNTYKINKYRYKNSK